MLFGTLTKEGLRSPVQMILENDEIIGKRKSTDFTGANLRDFYFPASTAQRRGAA